jgi:predicted DNA binding CopG/RHH family protein
MTIQLDEEEQDILDSVERREWQSVRNLQQEIGRYQRHAQAYIQSIPKITIELSSSDIASLYIAFCRGNHGGLPIFLG